MEKNWFYCGECKGRTCHVEITTAEVLSSDSCGKTSKKVWGAFGEIMDKTGLPSIVKCVLAIKYWKCTKCGLLSERLPDGTCKHYKQRNSTTWEKVSNGESWK